MRFPYVVLGAILIATIASGAHASTATVTAARHAGATDMVQIRDDLKVLEQVAGSWSPEWRHELPKQEAVSLAQTTIRNIDDLLAAKRESAGELLLMKGLAAHYAYNLDAEGSFDLAVESLTKARKALPSNDCRPQWYLGNHLALAADAEKGIPLLKEAAHECGKNLPVSFWEDYAYAAVVAAMPATGQYALDQVKKMNSGVLTERMGPIQEGVKTRLVAPVKAKEYEPGDIWLFEEKSGTVRLVNGMYGFMLELPGTWRVAPFGVRKGNSGVGITLPKKGKWPPPLEVVMTVSPASPETSPAQVLRTFLAKTGRNFKSAAGPGVSTANNFLWVDSRQKKGSRVIAGVLRRPQPAYPGLSFESPHNLQKPEENAKGPRYYSPVQQLTRHPGELDYLIMIEGAPTAFDQGRADLELLLGNLVIE